MSSMKQVLEKIKFYQAQLQKQYQEKERLETKVRLKCVTNQFGVGCGKVTEIRKLVHLDMQYYVPPSGCSEGAYWVSSSEPHFLCTKCGHQNRTYERPQQKLIKERASLFMRTVKIYTDTSHRQATTEIQELLSTLKLESKDTRFE